MTADTQEKPKQLRVSLGAALGSAGLSMAFMCWFISVNFPQSRTHNCGTFAVIGLILSSAGLGRFSANPNWFGVTCVAGVLLGFYVTVNLCYMD
jgi:hypothetical protein